MIKDNLSQLEAYLNAQLKTNKSIMVGVLELVANEKANFELLYNLFSERISRVVKIRTFKALGYTIDGNTYMRVVLVTKPNCYPVVKEKMRYSGNDYFPLTLEVSSVWSKLLFDSKAFPSGLEFNNRFLSVDVLNGVELSAIKIVSIINTILDRSSLEIKKLEDRIKETKAISLKMLYSLEYNEFTYASSHTLTIEYREELDYTEVEIKLEMTLLKHPIEYLHTVRNKEDGKYIISLFIFEGENNQKYREELINELINELKRKYIDAKLTSNYYYEMTQLVDPREYANIKLLAEIMYANRKYGV